MKTPATLIDPEGNRSSVYLSRKRHDLVIERKGYPALHWPLAHLRETQTLEGLLQLQWPPGKELIEVSKSGMEGKGDWIKYLPSQAHRSSPYRALFWILLAVLFPYLLIELSAVTVRVLPRKWEKKLFGGSHYFSSSEVCGKTADSKGAMALDKMVKRIYPLLPEDKEFSIEVKVVMRKEKNAFTFPGGQIYVLDNLLLDAKTPEELTGVLAHEIEHVRHRHTTRSAVRRLMLHGILGFFFSLMGTNPNFTLLDELMGLQFNRGQEREADQGAIERLHKAQVSTVGFKEFFDRKNGDFKLPEFLSTHPSDSSRSEMIGTNQSGTVSAVLTAEEWESLKAICN